MIIKESPLKGMSIGTVDSIFVRELPGLHTVDIRVASGSTAHAAIIEALGIDLPEKVGQSQKRLLPNGAEAHALCLAPDWWLIIGHEEAGQKLASLMLKDEYHFSVVDVSGQRTTIELEGPKACEVLAQLWEQDIREKIFPVGNVSQGLMAKAPVILFYIAPFRYLILVRSSFALHLSKALVDAAAVWM